MNTMLKIVGVDVMRSWFLRVDASRFNILHFIVFRAPYGHLAVIKIMDFICKFLRENDICDVDSLLTQEAIVKCL